MHNTVFIPVAISWLICLAIIATLPVRSKKLLSISGRCLITLKRASVSRHIMLFIFCLILSGTVLVRNLGMFMDCIVCAAAVLACEITCRDYLVAKFGGLYENGLLAGNRFLPLSSIISIPSAAWEDSESSAPAKTQLEIVTTSGSAVISFSRPETLIAVRSKLLELKPALKV